MLAFPFKIDINVTDSMICWVKQKQQPRLTSTWRTMATTTITKRERVRYLFIFEFEIKWHGNLRTRNFIQFSKKKWRRERKPVKARNTFFISCLPTAFMANMTIFVFFFWLFCCASNIGIVPTLSFIEKQTKKKERGKTSFCAFSNEWKWEIAIFTVQKIADDSNERNVNTHNTIFNLQFFPLSLLLLLLLSHIRCEE